MFSKRTFTCLFIFQILALTYTVNSNCLSLDEVVDLALSQDAQLKADIFNAEARNAEGWQAIGEYGSNLHISGSYMNSRDTSDPDKDAEIEKRSVNFNEADFTVGFEQPIIDIEKANIARKGFVLMDMAELLKKKGREDLLLKVHERYYSLLSSMENLRLAKAESEALLRQLQNAKEKLELGFGTITDQHNAEARYSLAMAAEVSRKTEMTNATRALEEIINQKLPEQIDDLEPNFALPTLPSTESNWLQVAKLNNSELSIKRLEEKAAKLKHSASQSKFLPNLVMFADYNERHPEDSLIGYGERRTEMDVGIRLNLDLLSGGRDTAATVVSSKQAKAAREQKNVSELMVIRTIGSLWESINQTEKLVNAYKKAVNANQLAMESTQASHDEGVKVLLDVLNAQQDFFRSMREYKTSRYEYMVLLQRFRQAIGIDTLDMQYTVKKGQKLSVF